MKRDQYLIIRDILERRHDEYLKELHEGNARAEKVLLMKRINAVRTFFGYKQLTLMEVSE